MHTAVCVQCTVTNLVDGEMLGLLQLAILPMCLLLKKAAAGTDDPHCRQLVATGSNKLFTCLLGLTRMSKALKEAARAYVSNAHWQTLLAAAMCETEPTARSQKQFWKKAAMHISHMVSLPLCTIQETILGGHAHLMLFALSIKYAFEVCIETDPCQIVSRQASSLLVEVCSKTR